MFRFARHGVVGAANLARSAGLVAEAGGVLSHLAVQAREFKVPEPAA
ncbi:hypothetical protein SGFS_062650 [Streptomyces graminofaciens]|uniref:PEP-utilising enzyme mobile domain-containing protein n=1 Tax=Streptomyces graminofaciens TaxID=68212 RepID=A0ABN5VPB7_9ACTN|nr:PEP-utilizing enzyme [Streptomyces graminofaciens]BBC34971.1 hypothetical protein SGFS_062650 [Streptomyces graminofaciens]